LRNQEEITLDELVNSLHRSKSAITRDLNLLLKYDLVHRQTVLDVLIDDQVYRMAITNRQNLFDHVLGCRTQLRHYLTPFYLTVSTVNSFTTHLSMANHP